MAGGFAAVSVGSLKCFTISDAEYCDSADAQAGMATIAAAKIILVKTILVAPQYTNVRARTSSIWGVKSRDALFL